MRELVLRRHIPGSTSMRRVVMLSLIVWLCGYTTVEAQIFNLSSRLDRALDAADAVVAGHIVVIRHEKPKTEWDAPLYPDFSFEVQNVLLGDPKLEGQVLDFPRISLLWPDHLVPLEKGVFCILLLNDNADSHFYRRFPKFFPSRYSPTVAPANHSRFSREKDKEGVRKVLVREILNELETETGLQRQRLLIREVSAILDAKNSKQLLPFLDSDNSWVRRAALAAITRATHDEKYIELAAADIRAFLKSRRGLEFITEKNGVQDPALEIDTFSVFHSSLFEDYDFLITDWDDANDHRMLAFLPLFRLIVAELDSDTSDAWQYGYAPLSRVGTKDDLMTLYRCYDEVLDYSVPHQRAAMIKGMARILELPPPEMTLHGYVEYLKEEKIAFEQIQSSLQSLGLIQKKKEADTNN